MPTPFIITLSCPDRVGIVHAVSACLVAQSANITEAAQFNDASTGLFFMRVRFDVAGSDEGLLRGLFTPIATAFEMSWGLYNANDRLPTVLMVSRLGHCLNHLLFHHSTHPLPLDIRAIVSNHRDYYQLAASHNIPFHHVPVTPATKAQAESRLLDIVAQEKAELVVLARYMQVLSDPLCRELAGKAINIHHSFLPSFKGAKPYQQAFDRGVKTIGATAHYVTAELDEGPIIEQGTARADHSMSVAQLTAIGRDIESAVLTRAVTWHAERRVLVNGHKTVVFQ